MKRRNNTVLDDTDEESDSNNAVNGSRITSKKKTSAGKQGRAPGRTKKKAARLLDDSDDEGSTQFPHNASDEESENNDNSDSDSTINNSTIAKKKATARKRGTPPKKTKQNNQKLPDDSDDGGSTRPNTPHTVNNDLSENDDSSVSDVTINNSTTAKKNVNARKPGRPPKTTKQKLPDIGPTTPNAANNDLSQNDDSSDSDMTVNNSTIGKKTATARKRGRPSKTSKQNSRKLPDDSDDGGSTRPNTPHTVNNVLSQNDDSSDSDVVTPTKRIGRPSQAFINKRQRLQNGILRDSSPQPSTSQNGNYQSASEFENDSDSNSADSDCGPVNERSIVKKKRPGQQLPQRTLNARVAKKKLNYSASNNAGRSSQSNASQKKDASMDLNLIDTLAQKLVYYLFVEDQKKYAIRRKGIVTHVFKDDYSPKLYGAVIKKANTILKKNYGMELMELENQKDSYLIVNILRRELGIHEYVDLPRIKQQQHGLILFLLSVIFMNENVITEDELTKCLKPLGIDLTSKRVHPVFGDVKKYITTELVKQMYLNYECISKEPPNYEFTWGLRAKQEFDKLDLLQFVCKIWADDIKPEDWRIQFRDAEASAKSNADS